MITKFGSKIAAFALVSSSVLALSACNGLPTCNDELDECNRGSAYTEERTVQANKKKAYVQPAPAPEPAPEPVVQAPPPPAPEPVIDDTPIMQSAEPQFTTISK